MTKPYLEWIDDQINRHQTEIARLTVARGVIEEAGDVISRSKARTPKLLTKPEKKQKRAVGSTRSYIKAALLELGQPSLPGTINATIRARYPEITAKAIANGLYNARQTNEIARTPDGLYALPEMLKPIAMEKVA